MGGGTHTRSFELWSLTVLPFIDLGVTTDLKSVGDLQRAKPLRSSG
jgi:hypothetical protein